MADDENDSTPPIATGVLKPDVFTANSSRSIFSELVRAELNAASSKRKREDDPDDNSLNQQPPLKVYAKSGNAIIPKRESVGAAGYDLASAYEYEIAPKSRLLIKTDLCIIVPSGYYGRIASRSSLSLKHGIEVGAGVIDSDYRGPVGIVLFNHSDESFKSNTSVFSVFIFTII